MSDREKETIHQVVLPDFGAPSLPKRPTATGPDPSSLVEQVSDRVTVGTGGRGDSVPTPKRQPAHSRGPVPPSHNHAEPEAAETLENHLSALNFPTVAELEKCLSPIAKRPARPNTLRLILASAIAGIIVIVLFVAVKRTSHAPSKTAAVPQKILKAAPALPPEPLGKPLQLPSFVPTASLDAAYTRANPGWERYVTAETEYRVFREGSAIRALQAIDLTGKGIPEEFAKKALAEVADLTEAVPRTTERKGVYLIERSQPSPVTRAVLYRKDPSRQIKAFVVYFD